MKQTMRVVIAAMLAVLLIATGINLGMFLSNDSISANSDYLFAELISRDITTLVSDEICDVGEYAFACCKRLTHVDLSGAEYIMIGEEAFAECVELQSASFFTLMVIDNRAFGGCENLTRVVFYDIALGEPYVGDDVFAGTPIEQGDGYIYVPKNKIEVAKELFWQYEEQVRAIEDGYVK